MNTLPSHFKIHVPTPELSELVQNRLFEHGYGWQAGDTTVHAKNAKFLFGSSKTLTHAYGDKDYFDKHQNQKITIEELFLIPVVKSFSLNDEWSARRVGEIIHVEGKTESFDFPVSVLKELKAALDNPKSRLPACFKIHVPAPELSELVQKKLFECGVYWYGHGKEVEESDAQYLFVDKGFISYSRLKDWFNQKNMPQLSLEKFFSSSSQPDLKIGKHKVEIFDDTVKVGCQTFSKEKVIEFITFALNDK